MIVSDCYCPVVPCSTHAKPPHVRYWCLTPSSLSKDAATIDKIAVLFHICQPEILH